MSGSKNSFTPAPGASEGLLHGPRLAAEVRALACSPGRSEEEIDLLGSVALALEATPPTVWVAAQAAVAAYDKGDDVWGGIDQLRRALIEEPMPRVPEALVVKARLTPELEAMIREHLKRPVPRLGMIPNAMEISLVDHASERGVEPALGGPPRFYDSLRAVLGRPDVAEAFAKGLCHHNGGNWEEATEGGRNAFREEAGHLIEEALAAPRETLPREQCPDCDRTVFVGNPPTMGFIAECGRRITTLAECGVKTCPVVRPE